MSLPYLEKAALAITGEFTKSGHQIAVVRPVSVKKSMTDLARAFGIRGSLVERLGRDLKYSTETTTVSPLAELLQIGAKLSRSHILDYQTMYHNARVFDEKASACIKSESRSVFGFPGASLRSFEAAKKLGLPRIFHAVNAHPKFHNHILVSAYGEKRARWELIPERVEQRIIDELSLSTLILAPSREVKRQFIEEGVDPNKIVVVPYGAELSSSPKSPAQPGVKRSRPIVLFVGQVSLRKGVKYLVEAARNQNFDVILAGPLVDRRSIENLPDNVRYCGAVSPREVNDLMANADVFALPTLEDACALVVGEAIANGLPVITTDANGASELFSSDDILLVASASIKELRAALLSVHPLNFEERSARATRFSGGQNGLESWAAYGAKVLQLILTSEREF